MFFNPPRQESGWSVEKKIPVALILTMVFQTAGALWWAASISAFVESNQRRISVLEQSIDGIAKDAGASRERLVRVEEKITAQTTTLNRIDEAVRKK